MNTKEKNELNFKGHSLLGKIAFSSLPQWEKKMLQPDMSQEGLDKPCFPKGITTVEDKAGAMCSIMDWIYYEEFRPYAILPDGRWIPHCPPDASGQASGNGRPKSNTVLLEMIEWLLERMLEKIKSGNWEEAIRWGGTLGHFLQEPFTPGHAVDNNLFHQFFPDPDAVRHMRLHHKFDAASGGFTPLKPKLMGISIPEAAFRLQVEIDRGIRSGMKLVGRIISSVYAGQPKDEQQKILSEQSRLAAFVTASAWHTLMSIAFDRWEKKAVESLSALSLTYMVPYFIHHTEYVEILPGHLVKKERKIPIYVKGLKGEELVKNGFGMTGHQGIKFFVNGNVYPRFRCRVGLPSRHTKGQTENTNTVFFVETDTRENLVYSEDMEYKAKRIVSIPLIPGESVKEIDVSIKGAKTLILTAQSKSYTTQEGQVRFDIPHVAVCKPVISKK